MRKLKHFFFAFAMCALVSSCGLTTGSAIMKVQKGMSQEEVSRLLGKPDFRRFDNGSEQWEYKKTNLYTATDMLIIIDFIDGQVANMDSFRDEIPAPPIAVCPPAEIISVERPIYPNHPDRHKPRRRPINPQDFQSLYNRVKNKPFKDDQMELLAMGIVNNYFTCQQTADLMSVFTWDDEKMNVLNMICERIVDRENGEVIVKKLDSLFKQDDARKILGISERW